MRSKPLVAAKSLLVVFMIFYLPSQALGTSWAYSFVVWDDHIYIISDEYITHINDEIGHVTNYSDMEQYGGNFSNTYKKGTKYYSIEGISTDEAIAVNEGNGKYRKAIREGEYTYNKGVSAYAMSILGTGAVLLILFLVYTRFF